MNQTVTLVVDGRSVVVPAGRSVAAALTLDQDRPGWRTTRREGTSRGLFCGIGVCFDCLATVDGVPGLRTCLVECADGMDVHTGASEEDHDAA